MVSKVVQEVIDQNVDLYCLIGITSADIRKLYGRPSGIPSDDIRGACKRAQFNNHPDRNGDHDTFIKIQNAVEILTNKNDRDVYDNWYSRRFIIGNDPTPQQKLQDIANFEQETLSKVQEYDEMLRRIHDFNLPVGDWSLEHINKLKQNAGSTDLYSDKEVLEESRFKCTGTLNMMLTGTHSKLLTFSERKDLKQIIATTFHIDEEDIFKIGCLWKSRSETNLLYLTLQLWNPIDAQSIFQKYGGKDKDIDLGDNILLHSIASCASPEFYKRIKLPKTELNPMILETIHAYSN